MNEPSEGSRELPGSWAIARDFPAPRCTEAWPLTSIVIRIRDFPAGHSSTVPIGRMKTLEPGHGESSSVMVMVTLTFEGVCAGRLNAVKGIERHRNNAS